MNGRLDTLQAAVLLTKLDCFDEELQRREMIAQQYDQGLASIVEIPARVANSQSAWAIYSVLLSDSEHRQKVQEHLKAQNIPTAIYYPLPLHKQPAYRKYHNGSILMTSEDISERILALPIHPDLTDEEVNRVIMAIQEVHQ